MPETRSLSVGRLTADPAWTRRHDPDDRGPCKQRRPPTLERPSTRHPNPHQSACQPPRTHALQRIIGLAPRRQAATTTEPFMPHPKGGASGRHETNRHRRKKPSSEDRSIAARRWTHEGSRCTDSRLLHHQHQHQLATNTRHQLKTSHAARTKNGDQFQRSVPAIKLSQYQRSAAAKPEASGVHQPSHGGFDRFEDPDRGTSHGEQSARMDRSCST